MGSCSSGHALEPGEKEITKVLMKYSRHLEPEEFASIIDSLKQCDIITDPCSLPKKPDNRTRSSLKRKQSSQRKYERDGNISVQEQKNKKSSQKFRQDDEIKRLQNEIQTLKLTIQEMEQHPAALLPCDGNDHPQPRRNKRKESDRKLQTASPTSKLVTLESQPSRNMVEGAQKMGQNLEEEIKECTLERNLQSKTYDALTMKSVEKPMSVTKTINNVQTSNSNAATKNATSPVRFVDEPHQYVLAGERMKHKCVQAQLSSSPLKVTTFAQTEKIKCKTIHIQTIETDEDKACLLSKISQLEEKVEKQQKDIYERDVKLIKTRSINGSSKEDPKLKEVSHSVLNRDWNTRRLSNVVKSQTDRQTLKSDMLGSSENTHITIGKVDNQLTEELERLQHEYHTSRKELESLRNDNALLSSKVETLQQNTSALKQRLANTEDNLKAVETERDTLAEELETTHQEHQKTSSYLAGQLESFKGDKSVLLSTVDQLQSEVALLEKQRGVTNDELKIVKLNKTKLTQENVKIQEEHQKTHSCLKEQVIASKSDSTALSSQVKALQQTVVSLRSQVGVGERQLKIAQLHKNKMTQEFESLKQESHKFRAELEGQIATVSEENSALLSRIENFQQNISVLESQLGESEHQLNTERSSKAKGAQELERLKQEYLTKRTAMEKEIELLKGDNTALLSTKEKHQLHIAKMETQLVDREHERNTAISNKEKLAQELERLKQEYHTTRTDMGKEIESVKGENTALLTTIEKHQCCIATMERQNVDSEHELKIVLANKDKLAQELDKLKQDYQASRTAMGNEIDLLKGDNTALQSSLEKDQRRISMLERQLEEEYREKYRKRMDAEQVGKLMDVPWRDEPIFDQMYLQNVKDEIEHFWPLKDMGVAEGTLQHVNILFVGPIAAGKSSFINSVESAFRGHVTMTASAGSRSKSLTSTYHKYQILSSDNRRPLKFQLCDCRGLEERANISRDINSILEGHIPDNYVFNTSFPMISSMKGYESTPRLKDQIHCVVFVLDASTYSEELGIPFVSEPVRDAIKVIQDGIDQKGIPQLVILSKVDSVCESTKLDTSQVYRSPVIRQRCMNAADFLGVPPMVVLPMKNYLLETSTNDDVSILALYNIRQMLRAADAFLRTNYLRELKENRQV
ncbi:uncharacterized protein [Argopecten irradians]|uniref:uncharacterized protein n=1 Tax=Argopecten irradians TaxID=31199 RepID=UPI0037107966